MIRDSRLLVLIPDRLSDLVQKGEITDRYYNPGDLFGEVHIALTNDDCPDPGTLQRMVGSARLVLHNLRAGSALFAGSLGWRPSLLNRWADGAVDLARAVRPSLVRCHASGLHSYAGWRIKQRLGVPLVISLHTNPGELSRVRLPWKQRIANRAIRAAEIRSLRGADIVLPVYEAIVPWLDSIGGVNYRVCYNALGASIGRKVPGSLNDPVRILSVGRQFREKNPESIIRAVSELPRSNLTLIGDGAEHQALVTLADSLGVRDRVEFIPNMPNDVVCARLPEFDIFAAHYEFGGVPKTVMEAMLAALPCVLNREHWGSVRELEGAVLLVDNSATGYRDAFVRLMNDNEFRAALADAGARAADALWNQTRAEARFIEVYRSLLSR